VQGCKPHANQQCKADVKAVGGTSGRHRWRQRRPAGKWDSSGDQCSSRVQGWGVHALVGCGQLLMCGGGGASAGYACPRLPSLPPLPRRRTGVPVGDERGPRVGRACGERERAGNLPSTPAPHGVGGWVGWGQSSVRYECDCVTSGWGALACCKRSLGTAHHVFRTSWGACATQGARKGHCRIGQRARL
jgi:hypothetical protein